MSNNIDIRDGRTGAKKAAPAKKPAAKRAAAKKAAKKAAAKKPAAKKPAAKKLAAKAPAEAGLSAAAARNLGAINRSAAGKPDPRSAQVTGQIRTDRQMAAGGVRVVVSDTSLAGKRVLGTAVTDQDGRYALDYDVTQVGKEGGPDLLVQAFDADGKQLLGASNVDFNAGRDAAVDVVVPASLAQPGTEYRQLTDALRSQLTDGGPKRLAELKETAERPDITYLANKTGWDARMVAMAALADRFSGDSGIAPELYYALFRAGLPANPDVVAQMPASAAAEVWKQAIKDGVIPDELSSQIPAAAKRWRELSSQQLLARTPIAGPSDMAALLSAAGIKDDGQRTFARLYADNRQEPDKLWDRVGRELGDEAAQRLQLTGKLGFLTINNAPLLDRLARLDIRDPVDLVAQGFAQPAAWKRVLSADVTVPAEVPGESEAEKRSSYAELMANQLRLSYPTAVITEQLRSGEFKLRAPDAVRSSVQEFLISQQGKFELGMHPVDTYLKDNQLNLDTAAADALRTLARVWQISPSDSAMAGLLRHGFDSAYAVVQYTEAEFINAFGDDLGGLEPAKLTFAKSSQVHNTVLNIASSYRAALSAPELYALPQQSTAADVDPTLEMLLGEQDYCDCDHCRSVLGPAAYLVDLLQFIELRRFNSQGEELPKTYTGDNPIDVLLERRPDLAHLQLSCENTNNVLPYIDIVNEVCEYCVAHNLALTGFTGHDVPDGVSTADLLASPQFVDEAAYTALGNAVFPLGLPFSPALAALRRYLQHVDLTLADAMTRLRPSDGMDGAAGSYGWRDIFAERIGLSRAEAAILTDGSIKVQELFGADPATVTPAELVADIGNAKRFSRRLDVSYMELVDLLRTSFVNPDAHLLPKIAKLGVGFGVIKQRHDGAISPADFAALLPDDLDSGQYGGDILDWLDQNYDRIMGLLVLSDPAGEVGIACGFDTLELRHALPDNAANKVTAIELRALVRFIRLWRKLGWSIANTDRALTALWPAQQRPLPGDSAATLAAKQNAGFAAVIPGLAHVIGALERLDLSPKKHLPALLASFAPIDSQAPISPADPSLYQRLFLSPSVLRIDGVFAEDGYGGYPKDPAAKLFDHALAVQASFNVTSEEFDLIAGKLGYDLTTQLSLETLSAIYRRAYLARTLRMSVSELHTLMMLTGLDPFGPLDGVRPAFAEFTELAQLLKSAGLPIPRLAYLISDVDLTGKSGPQPDEVLAQARLSRAELIRIEKEYAVVDDPTGEVTAARMALVYGQEATGTFFGLLAGGPVVSVAFNNGSADLSAPIQTAAPGLAYDDFTKQLSFRGVMTAATRDTLRAIPGTGAAFDAAIAELHAAGQAAVRDFFDRYPELEQLYEDFIDSPTPLAQRWPELLAKFLPELHDRLKRQAIRQAFAAETGIDPAEAAMLLEDPRVLHSADNPGAAAIADLLAIENGGASAMYYFADDVTGQPDEVAAVVSAIDYQDGGLTLPTRPGDPAAPISGVWAWYAEASGTGFINVTVEADAGAEIELEIGSQPVAMTQQGSVWHNQQPVQLQAGVPTAMRLTARKVRQGLTLRWQARGGSREVIPAAASYPALVVDDFATTRLRLLKALSLAEQLDLSVGELTHFAVSEQIDSAGWLNALPASVALPASLEVTPEPPAARVHALFGAVANIARYTELRRGLGADGESLVAGLQDPESAALSPATGWNESAIDQVLAHMSLSRADLAQVPILKRLSDAMEVTQALGIAPAAMLSAVGPDPTPAAVAALQDAVRARYDEDAWHEIVKPINDDLRGQRRDALVAYILHGLAANTATAHIDTVNKLFEYFLIDVAMEPCMNTSRIKQAISTVQLFIQRSLLNLEDGVAASSINSKRWAWMKRYRVWEANRKLFLWPENWLEPELRDDKSPFFKELESELLAGDITEDAAALATGHYLEQLAQVAKLEIAGICVEENDGTTSADDVVHVIGRTSGARRSYYYRKLAGLSWSPWTKINAEIEDNPIIPVVWKHRLFVFWLSVAAQGEPTTTSNKAQDSKLTEVKLQDVKTTSRMTAAVNLHWSEFFNGKWQPVQTSDLQRPLYLGSFAAGDFDRSQLSLSSEEIAGGSLRIGISGQGDSSYFTLHNTHSLPLRPQDDQAWLYGPYLPGTQGPLLLHQARSFSTYGGLSVDYFDPYRISSELTFTQQVLGAVQTYDVVAPAHYLSDVFGAPFFLQDRRYAFYVKPVQSQVTIITWPDFGIQEQPPKLIPTVPPIYYKPELDFDPRIDPDPVPFRGMVRPGIADPGPLRSFLNINSNVSRALATGGSVGFDGVLLGPGGVLTQHARSGRN